jgi:DNA polymerase III subunit delta'
MWQTVGQPKIVDLLTRAMEQDSLSHAYLMVGPPQVGKMTLALDLATALNCREEKEKRPCGECLSCQKIKAGKHADVQVVGLNQGQDSGEVKERTEIGIDRIKDMLHSANLPPFEGDFRVYIIDEAGNLSMDAANRLLKTLEEPTGKVVFILLTAQARLIPETVISRCQRLNLRRLKVSEVEEYLISRRHLDLEKAKLLARLSHGCLGWAIQAGEDTHWLEERREQFEKMRMMVKGSLIERFEVAAQMALQFGRKRESVYETMDAWTGWWRDLLLVQTGCRDNIINIDFGPALVEMAGAYSLAQIKTAIQNTTEAVEQLKLNANSRLVMEVLMLNLPRPGLNQRSGQEVEVKNA